MFLFKKRSLLVVCLVICVIFSSGCSSSEKQAEQQTEEQIKAELNKIKLPIAELGYSQVNPSHDSAALVIAQDLANQFKPDLYSDNPKSYLDSYEKRFNQLGLSITNNANPTAFSQLLRDGWCLNINRDVAGNPFCMLNMVLASKKVDVSGRTVNCYFVEGFPLNTLGFSLGDNLCLYVNRLAIQAMSDKESSQQWTVITDINEIYKGIIDSVEVHELQHQADSDLNSLDISDVFLFTAFIETRAMLQAVISSSAPIYSAEELIEKGRPEFKDSAYGSAYELAKIFMRLDHEPSAEELIGLAQKGFDESEKYRILLIKYDGDIKKSLDEYGKTE